MNCKTYPPYKTTKTNKRLKQYCEDLTAKKLLKWEDYCDEWKENKKINPVTHRGIQKGKDMYNLIRNRCEEVDDLNDDDYVYTIPYVPRRFRSKHYDSSKRPLLITTGPSSLSRSVSDITMKRITR